MVKKFAHGIRKMVFFFAFSDSALNSGRFQPRRGAKSVESQTTCSSQVFSDRHLGDLAHGPTGGDTLQGTDTYPTEREFGKSSTQIMPLKGGIC